MLGRRAGVEALVGIVAFRSFSSPSALPFLLLVFALLAFSSVSNFPLALFLWVHPFSSAEFARVARATGLGFLIMGFVGFFVKIVHIPINNILMGGM